MTWLTNLMRPDLRELAAYRSARTEADGFIPEIGIDANEFPWPPFGFASAICKLNRYPDSQPAALLGKLAALWNVAQESILVARGSDEGIDVLIRMFCRAGTDQILICPPTYGMYKVAANVQGAEVVKVPLRSDGQIDVKGVLKACSSKTKVIFIPSPNAPMGHLMKRDDILALCKARAEKSLVVVDEAYIEFSDKPEGMLPDVPKIPNLVVLRTLSKAHALAGERIGVVLGAAELIQNLLKILAPYPLTQTSIRSALDALSPNGLIQNAERRRLLVSERERMARLLLQSEFILGVFPSVANFILVQTNGVPFVMMQLRRQGILARDRSSEIPNTVRLSIGTPEENDLVLKALGIKVETPTPTQRLFSTHRQTKETSIDVTVNLDEPTFLKIDTGLGFFDHMLEQIATHGGFGLALTCKGDLQVDTHHSIEDCALALGETLKNALGDKRGIGRYGFTTPLDEAIAQVTIDLSGRPYFVFEGKLLTPNVGELPCEMIPHFFQSLATSLGASIHLTVQGENAHHIIEAAFKATGRALRQAFRREGNSLPSTKGTL
jgi:histidinol-phosphate aminotransferase